MKTSPSVINCKVSLEKAENVVKAPKNPNMTRASNLEFKDSKNKPTRKHPSIFTDIIPNGIENNVAL